MSDALYDGPNRVIIDDNTPETNTLPISGGKGVDEFLITHTANSVVIDDDSEANVIVFERDVVITSIERQAGSEGASVAQYVITLSSGKTITLRNPASFTFQHLGDATRTDPISAEDFFTAYEDGFAASDASHPDIIGDASGPSGVQGPMITGTATGARTEDEIDPVTGTLSVSGTSDPIVLASSTNFDERAENGDILTTYGRMSFDGTTWSYSVRASEVNALRGGEEYIDTFTFTADGASFDVVITLTGTNDPTVLSGLGNTYDNEAFFNNFRSSLTSPLEDRAEVVLSSLFTDPDDDLTITFLVYYLTVLGNNPRQSLNDVTYKVYDSTDPSQTLEEAIGLTYDPVTTRISGTFDYHGWYRFDVTASDGRGNSPSVKFWRSISQDNFHSPVIGGDNENTVIAGNDLQGSASGSISITDRDQHHPITFPTITLVSGAGTYGTMTFDGRTWTYTVDNDDPDTIGLAGGDEVNETFTFTAEGARRPFTVTIRVLKALPPVINGVDNTPALTAGDDAAKTATGIVTVNDEDELDLTQLPGVVLTNEGHGGTNVQDVGTTMSLKGTYGTLTFTPTAGPPPGGTWVYTLDNEDPDTLALRDGETGEDEFILRAEGAEDFAVLVTVTGVNDAPVVDTPIEEQSGTAAGQEIKPIDLSGLFTDSNNDELALTLAVMLDGRAIDFEDTGLKYDPLTKNLFGTPNAEGTYTITVTASDSRGGTDTSTFNIVVGPFEAVIELSNLVYNVGGEVIVISQDNLLTSHVSQYDPSKLVYLIQDLPTNGTLWKGDTQLDDQSGSNRFTQEDVNNGLITYRPSDSSSAQSDSFSFVVLNLGVLPPKQVPGVFQITPREDVEVSVVDGPVASAEVFFDLNGDGEVTDAEKDAQRDASGRSLYITGDDGTVDIPEQYVGRAFVADVGSAYDIDSGERLEGEFRSLDEAEAG